VRAPAGAAAVAVEAQIDKRGFNESIRRAKQRLEGLETRPDARRDRLVRNGRRSGRTGSRLNPGLGRLSLS
jgi:hypothetical protein